MDSRITGIDGNAQKQTEALKQLFGLNPEQTFQDLDVDIDEEDIDKNA